MLHGCRRAKTQTLVYSQRPLWSLWDHRDPAAPTEPPATGSEDKADAHRVCVCVRNNKHFDLYHDRAEDTITKRTTRDEGLRFTARCEQARTSYVW